MHDVDHSQLKLVKLIWHSIAFGRSLSISHQANSCECFNVHAVNSSCLKTLKLNSLLPIFEKCKIAEHIEVNIRSYKPKRAFNFLWRG